MDNNNLPEQNESKKFNKNNNFRHRRSYQKPQPHDNDEASPNGSITVKPGRYDLPPESSETMDDRSEKQEHSQRPQKKNRNEQSEQRSGDQKNSRRRSKSRKHQNSSREHSGNISTDELSEIAEEEVAISEYIAVTSQPDGEPSEAEIIEELNSAVDESEAPGSETVESEGETAASMQEDEKPEELATYEIIGVRFKSTGKIYYFDPDGHKFKRSDAVIVDTARGLEYGIVDLSNRMVTEREVVLPLRKAVRRATEDDIARAKENAERAAEAFSVCGEKIIEHKLEMKLVDVEYTFDNSKLLFYFTAEGRVDFRELVKDLASVFKTRIELRQIGIRDETKLLGGMGICGRPFCCKTFLSDFVQVSIKMAKEQNLSLNSAKISGACGRLMCCLRYEYDTYAEEIKKTPKVDQIVTTPDGEGIVTEVQPLAGLCRVRFTERQDMQPKVYHRDVLTVIGGKGAKKAAPKSTAKSEEEEALSAEE